MAGLRRVSGSVHGGPGRRAGAGSGRALQAYHGVVLSRLDELRRARIIGGMFDVVEELGAGSVSVAHVVERSGVSRRTFYEEFSDREDCFLAAFENALELARERVLPAYESEDRWRDRIRCALTALLSFLDEQPTIGRLLIVESLSGGPRTLEHRGRVLEQLAVAVDEGRTQSAGAAGLPPLTAEGLVGGVLSVISVRLARAGGEPLVGLVNQLTGMIVLPYQGAAIARREIERPVVDVGDRHDNKRLLFDPFKAAGMRLTYRTMLVLLAVGELGERGSGPSNRQIGDSAGISDPGQISKLLARLERIGLISKAGLGPGLGGPNAWSLTEKGQELARSIRAHTGTADRRESR